MQKRTLTLGRAPHRANAWSLGNRADPRSRWEIARHARSPLRRKALTAEVIPAD
jgi:hypothetical protein